MGIILTIVGLYFLVLIGIGIIAAKRGRKTVEDYFVANRSIGVFVLVMSVFATLFSAFTFVAEPGMVYSLGTGFWAGLPLGNIMFSSFILMLGYKIWQVGRKNNLVTPVELFKDRFESPALAVVMFVVMAILVLPYLAIQPIAAGHMLAAVSNGSIPYLAGATLVTAVIIIYVFISGQRAVAWTDTLQGILLLVVVWVTLFITAGKLGGFASASQQLTSTAPDMLTIDGPKNYWTWRMTTSWIIFIALNIMLQPQIFARYYTGRSVTTIKWSFATWPVLAALAIWPPVLIGAYGKLLAPNLTQADQIVPYLWKTLTPLWFQGIALAGLLSALMSTASGQLLSLSSMFTRDLYLPYIKPGASSSEQYRMGRVMVVVLAVAGLLIGIRPPALAGLLAGAAFSGISILAPAAIAAFYWRRATAPALIVSIIAGELIVLGTYFGLIPKSVWLGYDASIPGLLLTTILMIVISLFTKPPSEEAINRYMKKD